MSHESSSFRRWPDIPLVRTALTVAVITVGLMAIPMPASAAHVRHCGDSQNPAQHPWGNLRARHIGCRGARKVAHAYEGGKTKVRGFHCTSTQPVGGTRHVKCRRSNAGTRERVMFVYGF